MWGGVELDVRDEVTGTEGRAFVASASEGGRTA